MRWILQLGLMMLMLLGAGNRAWGRASASPAPVEWDCSPSRMFDRGVDAPPRRLASGEAAAWRLDVELAGTGPLDSTPTTAGPVVVTFHGTAFLMCPGAPPLVIGSFRATTPAWVAVGPNVYAYCKENPWSGFDPHGLEFFGTNEGNETPAVREAIRDFDHKFYKGLANTPRALKETVQNLPKVPGLLWKGANNPSKAWEVVKQSAWETVRNPEKLGEFTGTMYATPVLLKPLTRTRVPFAAATSTPSKPITAAASEIAAGSATHVESALSEAVAATRATGQPSLMYFQHATKGGAIDFTANVSVQNGKTLFLDGITAFPAEGASLTPRTMLSEVWAAQQRFMKAVKSEGFEKMRTRYERIGADQKGSTANPRKVDKTFTVQ